MNYIKPEITDHGSLADLTAMMNVGGPVDTYAAQPPGHSCPTGPPGPNDNANANAGNNNGNPPCVGNGGGVGKGNDFPGFPDYNPANPGQGGGDPPKGPKK